MGIHTLAAGGLGHSLAILVDDLAVSGRADDCGLIQIVVCLLVMLHRCLPLMESTILYLNLLLQFTTTAHCYLHKFIVRFKTN